MYSTVWFLLVHEYLLQFLVRLSNYTQREERDNVSIRQDRFDIVGQQVTYYHLLF